MCDFGSFHIRKNTKSVVDFVNFVYERIETLIRFFVIYFPYYLFYRDVYTEYQTPYKLLEGKLWDSVLNVN